MNPQALAAVAVLAVGCFNPQFQQGVPCTEDRQCPEGQVCHTDDRCYDPDELPEPSAALASLEVSAGTLVPPFDPEVTSYTLTLGIGAEELVVTPTAVDASASIDVGGELVSSGTASGPIPLALGDNLVAIDLATGDLSATYTIAVDRGSGLLQSAYLKTENTDSGDAFGISMAISGDTLVVGAPDESSSSIGVNGDSNNNDAPGSGAVYVFVRDGDSWRQQAYLKASNTDPGDGFGDAVAISGDTLAVGARGERSSASGVNGDQTLNELSTAGAAYVFQRVGEAWSQQAYVKSPSPAAGHRFGASVAVDANTLVVGAFGEAGFTGAAYVFELSNGLWSQTARLEASNSDSDDNFGLRVALSGDTLVVGASGEASIATGVGGDQGDNTAPDAGAAYIFERVGMSWTQTAYLKASNTDAEDKFGGSVAVSGDIVAVAAPAEQSSAVGVDGDQADNGADNAGAVYVFGRDGQSWAQLAYIKASNSEAFDAFGSAIALSKDGRGLAVGAHGEDSSATGIRGDDADNAAEVSGAVYLFVRTSSTWEQRAYIKAANTDSMDFFGFSLAFSANALIVGAPLEASAASGIDGDQNDNSAENAGAVYVFE